MKAASTAHGLTKRQRVAFDLRLTSVSATLPQCDAPIPVRQERTGAVPSLPVHPNLLRLVLPRRWPGTIEHQCSSRSVRQAFLQDLVMLDTAVVNRTYCPRTMERRPTSPRGDSFGSIISKLGQLML
jgi:hypothetical protein